MQSRFDSIQSGQQLGSQHMLSRSNSRLQSSIQKIDSHIRSTLPYLQQGSSNKKYIYFKYHKFFEENKIEGFKELLSLLSDQFQDKIEFRPFKERKELLKDNYNDNELHYLVVPKFDLDWASTFAKQEREENNSKVKIYVYGILKKQEYEEKMKIRSKKRVDAIPDFIEYFYFDEPDYPQRIEAAMEAHLDQRLREEGQHIKTWALSNKFAGKKVKKRTLHFFYEQKMEQEFTGIYKTYKKKSKSSWLQIYPFRTFEDVLKKIREREVVQTKELDVARKATSKLMSQMMINQPVSMKSVMKSGIMDMMGSQLNSSVITSSIRAINKLDKDDLNIMICNGSHPQIQKFRALVRAQKFNNWYLWQISQKSSDVLARLKDFLNEQARNNEILENQEYELIIHSKHLIIMAHTNDDATIGIFQSHRNVFNHMELVIYNDPDQFSLFLREGINSSQNFTIAVVPGGFRSFAVEYTRAINQFIAAYRSGEGVENYKFISSAVGRHGSNVFPSSNIIGQSSLTDVRGRYDEDLEKIMRERDKLFHPFEGLTGVNVYLLIQESIADLLDGLMSYIQESPRLKERTYMDKEWLKLSLQTLTIKDSVIVITSDATLREAQQVLLDFQKVYILNITDRQSPKQQKNVVASGTRQHIYQLLKNVNPEPSMIQDQNYCESTQDVSLARRNRILPKNIDFKPGNMISVRLPANLKDEESHKMENRLQKYFFGDIKIEYYKHPNELRILNKAEEPLAFIIWAYESTLSQKEKAAAMEELEFLKEMAVNQNQELRQEYVIYSDVPEDFRGLVEDQQHQRFKFISSRWERIEEYIIGHLKRPNNDSIYSDQTIIAFYNQADPLSKELIQCLATRRNNDKLNAANHIQLRSIQDLIPTLDEESPLFKYYILFNESQNTISLKDIQRTIMQEEYQELFIKVIVIKEQGYKKIEKSSHVRAVVNGYRESAEWMCNTTVIPVNYEFITPHVIVDRSMLHYYYFLDKYSALTNKFTFSYAATKEEVKQKVTEARARGQQHIWILVKQVRTLYDYVKGLQKLQNYKKGYVKFIYEGNESIHQNIRGRVVFMHDKKKDIQKFILDIFRRDKHVFFPSSVGGAGAVVLAILQNKNQKGICINKQEVARWQNILKAKIYHPRTVQEVSQLAQNWQYCMIYVVAPLAMRQELQTMFGSQQNVKRIVMGPFKEYDFRRLDESKVVSDNNEIFIGSYPAEITDYLRYLRYNIRKCQSSLQSSIQNEIIELYIQQQYKLSPLQVSALTTKNDSLLINKNGYKVTALPDLLKSTNNFNYLHVFVGDQQSGRQVGEYNNKYKRDLKFIDLKTSDLTISKGESKNKNWLLETNDTRELLTFLFNLPENRYKKALGHRGVYNILANPAQPNTTIYYEELQRIQKRNPNIVVNVYSDLGQQLASNTYDTSHILIHSQNQRQAHDNLNRKDLSFWVANEQYKNDKSYTSTGNKQFMAKKKIEFMHFMNQIPTGSSEHNVQPIIINVDETEALLQDIRGFGSRPISEAYAQLTFHPPFKRLPPEEKNFIPVDLLTDTIDSNPPTLANLAFLKADVPPQPMGLDVLKRIRDSLLGEVDGNILQSGVDYAPTKDFQQIKSLPDDFTAVPLALRDIPKYDPIIRQKLAILHPNTFEFTQIGEMLRSNLEPDQFSEVTLIPFRTEVDLEEYSKNNGQKLNGYDKIVVFLSNSYRKYDPILKTMKNRLGGRMEYFIFDDNFHVENHHKLKMHLRPFKIRKNQLPYVAQTLPKFFNRCGKILILVPNHLSRKYEGLKSNFVSVQPYSTETDTYGYLHSQNTFIILVVTRQTYHEFKMHAKISPCCILLVDTENELPEDELYLHRIWMYALYYGPNGEEHLRRILPTRPMQPVHDKSRYLFYSYGEEELVFVPDYDEYQKIFFKDWLELYNYLISIFKGRSNWLIKNSPGRPQLIPLNPVVLLENKEYMKAFKNDFAEQGYLNEERIARKSKIIMHQFSDLPEVFYSDDRDLARHLEKLQAPSVVLFNLSNQARISFLRTKFNRHKYIGLTDNSERWIDADGILLDVEDERLKKKQDVFINLFNKDVFDAWNDMRYFYLSNKANLDKARNIYFRTKEELLQIYNSEPNLLMTVFVQAKDVNHVPQAIMAEASEFNGRVKLILISVQFVDQEAPLYIKFNEIDPVIKHINDVQSAGRIDFMVYHEGEGERVVQTLIQRKKLKRLDDRVYQSMEEVEDIAVQIKGKYKKVYVVCFEDERQEIQNIFNKYAICNKGIPDEGVQFFFIDRKSFIIPNSSRIQPSSSQLVQNSSSVNAKVTATNTLPGRNSRLAVNGQDELQINVQVRRSDPRDAQYDQVITHREVIGITREQPEEDDDDEADYGVPSMDSNIKPANKLESILANKNYVLSIDDKLKGLFPVGKFFANKATFFTNPNEIPVVENGASQVIVSTQVSPQMVHLSEDPEKYVIVVGKVPQSQKNIGNVMVMKEEEIPGLIKRLEGSNVEDELNNIKNIDDFSKVRVVYDRDLQPQSKRRLLSASDKNPKIFPILYKNVNQLKTFLKEPDSLLLLMMKEVPPGLADAVEKQNKTIVKKKKVRMIVPKRSESDIDGLETILEEEEVEQEGDNLKYLSDEQVDVYLKLFETYIDQRPKITKPDDWQGERQQDRYEAEAADMDNITRLNVHSNIDPGNLLHENQIQKIKQRLTGDLIVLVVDNSKRGQVDEAIKRFNVLVQGYTNSMNLQNDIRDRKDNVTIAVIDRNMIDKLPEIKKKYPQTAFILQSDSPHDEGIEAYRPYLSGQIRKIADLDKIIADLYQQNERIRFNAESNRAASRFEMKRTSIVDLSNNERFSVGLSNQKSKKAFLFYKEPDNNHIRVKLGQNYANLNFIPYKSVPDFKRLIDTYNNYSSILIANGNDIPDLEDIVSKKKELIYVIRFNPPPELRDNPKVKKLLSTFRKDDLERFIMDQFQKFSLTLPYDDLGMKYKSTKNVEGKRYIQKYEPNTFGTTPRFARDFVPPKSKESTYSRRYMKSTSRSKLASRLDTLSPKGQRNQQYFPG